MTDSEILTEIDRIIQCRYHRWKNPSDDPRHRNYLALKEVAKRLRAGDNASPTATALENKIRGLDRSKERDGDYSIAALRDVALEARAKWPVIRQALAFLEDARKVDAQ